MNTKKAAEEFGGIDEKYLEEALTPPERQERRIIMKRNKIVAVAIVAAVLAVGLAVTAFSKEPSFRPGEYVFTGVNEEDVVIIHSLDELRDLPAGTPYRFADDCPPLNEEYSSAITVEYNSKEPEITDVQVNGNDVTITWYDPLDIETEWTIGWCLSSERNFNKNTDTSGETQYTIEGLEPGEYRVTVAGMTPDPDSEYQDIRLGNVMIFTVE